MNSCKLVSILNGHSKSEMVAHLAHVRADLARLGQKIDACHPFFRRQSRLSRKVVDMRDQSLKDVFHTGIRIVGVNKVDVVRDVVGVQVFQWRNLDLGGIHENRLCFQHCSSVTNQAQRNSCTQTELHEKKRLSKCGEAQEEPADSRMKNEK